MHVLWEITSLCNLNCIHCYSARQKVDEARDLTTAAALNVIDQLAHYGFTSVQFVGREPFLRPDILELAKFASSMGMTISFNTNGTILSKDLIRELAGVHIGLISISLDGMRVSNDKIRGAGVFNKVVDNIGSMVSLLPEVTRSYEIAISFTLNRQNYLDARGIVELAKQLHVDYLGVGTVTRSGNADRNWHALELSPEETLHAKEEIASALREAPRLKLELSAAPLVLDYLNKKYALSLSIQEGPCSAVTETFFINSNGIAYPCFHVHNGTATIQNGGSPQGITQKLPTSSLCEVFDSTAFRSFLQFKFRTVPQNVGICSTCSFSNKCYGCPLILAHSNGYRDTAECYAVVNSKRRG